MRYSEKNKHLIALIFCLDWSVFFIGWLIFVFVLKKQHKANSTEEIIWTGRAAFLSSPREPFVQVPVELYTMDFLVNTYDWKNPKSQSNISQKEYEVKYKQSIQKFLGLTEPVLHNFTAAFSCYKRINKTFLNLITISIIFQINTIQIDFLRDNKVSRYSWTKG